MRADNGGLEEDRPKSRGVRRSIGDALDGVSATTKRPAEESMKN